MEAQGSGGKPVAESESSQHQIASAQSMQTAIGGSTMNTASNNEDAHLSTDATSGLENPSEEQSVHKSGAPKEATSHVEGVTSGREPVRRILSDSALTTSSDKDESWTQAKRPERPRSGENSKENIQGILLQNSGSPPISPREDNSAVSPRLSNFTAKSFSDYIEARSRTDSLRSREERLKSVRKFSASLPAISSQREKHSINETNEEDKKKSNDALARITDCELATRKSWAKRLSLSVKNLISNTPKEFVQVLRGETVTIENMENLYMKLSEEPIKFVERFIEEGGVSALVSLFDSEATSVPTKVQLVSLQCIKTLVSRMNTNLEAVLMLEADKPSGVMNALVQVLRDRELKLMAVECLEEICQCPNGHKVLLKSLERVQQATKQKSKFGELVSSMDTETNPDVLVRCVVLLNTVINYTEDLKERLDIYNELFTCGLGPLLTRLREINGEDLQLQLDVLEDGMTSDYEELLAAKANPEPKSPRKAAVAEKNFVRVLIMLPRSTLSAMFTYDENTTARDLIEKIKMKYPAEEFLDYGMVFAFAVWLDEDKKLMGDYGLKGEEVLEFKMNEWILPVKDVASGQIIRMKFDPCATCANAVAELLSKFPVIPNEDYGIYVMTENGKEWLEDTKKLATYKSIQKEVTLEFKIKPLLITIKFKDDTFTNLLVDREETVKNLLNTLEKKMNQSFSDHGIFAEDTWLDEQATLISYNIQAGSVLKCIPKPREYTVQLPNGEERKFSFYSNQRISELLMEICDHNELNSRHHSLLYTSPEGKVKFLPPWVTLNELQIPSNAVLTMKKTEESETANADNVNIWDEPEKDIKPSMKESTGVQGFTLNDLVIALNSESDYDPEYFKTFIRTYESFTTPEILLEKLIERFRVPARIPTDKKILIQMRVCTVIKQWIETQPEGVVEVIDKLAHFIDTELVAKELEAITHRLKAMIASQKSIRTRHHMYQFKEAPPEPLLPKNGNEPLTLLHIDPLEIARQLCLPTFSIYTRIRPTELFNQAWSKPKLQDKAPNVLKMIDKFNFVASFVATALVSEPKLKQRAKLFEHMIKIAQHLRDLQNFHLLMAFISGLNNSAVLRLKWTRSKLGKTFEKTFEQLEQLCHMESSFKNIRQALSTALPPCIPYIGIYLMDLTFIEDGNPDYVQNNLINFEKRKLVSQILSNLLHEQFQKVGYNFQPVEEINSFLNNLPTVDERELYKRSLECEPRNCTKKELQ